MADSKKGDNMSQYKYTAMSNLVLQHDRRFVTRRGDETTGDPESLAGRINLGDMGSRNAREAAPARPPTQEKALKRKRSEPIQRSRAAGILSQADMNIEGLRYRPRTAATKDVYDLISTSVSQKLGGDYGLAVTASATDSILEFLKDDDMKDFDKKKEIDDILGITTSSKEFSQLVNLGKKITDYDVQDEDEEMADAGDEDEDLDEQQGVAVDFESDDEDEEGGGRTFEVRDEDEESEDELALATEDIAEDGAGPPPDAGDADEADGEDDGLVIENRQRKRVREEKDPDIVPAYDIDAYWLQRQIGLIYEDPHIQNEKTQAAESLLSGTEEEKPLREVENDLMDLFDYEHHELVAQLVKNRDKITWVTRWRRAAEDEDARVAVEKEMVNAGHANILKELRSRDEPSNKSGAKVAVKLDPMDLDTKVPIKEDEEMKEGLVGGLMPRRTLNLEDLKFDQGNHLMTNQNVKLPQGSTKRTFKGYEEIHVPAPKRVPKPNERPLISTSSLPAWARTGFGSSAQLNRIQTECFSSAFEDDGNMLICAPTGSGKTNVAMLAMLREIGKHRDPATGNIRLDDFKIIYIAPLKALVQEQVGNFQARLAPYGITVAELTGDRQMTKEQISQTQIIVTTPEKYDVITRKASDLSAMNFVRLICIDEIHLLHDDRGPVLESIVARTIRRTEQTGDPVRIVGLSATLPNYRDVATFLRVDPQRGLFHFDSTFRPCPLKQEFVGVTDRKAIKQLKTMNEVCYTKVLEQVGQNKNQMLIFVHSRKETAKTARFIRDKALELDTVGQILRPDAASREILREEAESVSNSDLKDLLPYSFGIHHAGMSRSDRTVVEDLFSDGSIQVLVCTATLAWGVNLPAHTVIIKGTQIYSPEKGSWVELSPQDVLQMLGRAGRPQYDTYGEGIIITTQTEMQYYLSLMNQQLPIESQFITKLADNLNAEVVLGNVRTRDEGVEWLGYTYLFVRMLRSPALYQVGADYDEDPTLEQKRVDLIHSAAVVLEKSQLIKYEKTSGRLQSTDLGRIASHYYITSSSMLTYNHHLSLSVGQIELFRIFALSDEFRYIPVRQDEKLEMAKLLGRVPIPVKETIDEPQCKINVLLQAYVSRLKLDGLALMADLVYVTQSAGRILRAIFEIALKRGWSAVAKDALDLCKTAEKRMWPTMTPLRQFPQCPSEFIKKAERNPYPWASYFDLDPVRMGQIFGTPKQGRQVCDLVAKFPRLELQALYHPITRSMLRVELTLTPKFEWDDELHGRAESWWIIVEDCDGEEILFHDQFLLRKEYAIAEANEHTVEFTVPLTEPTPPHYFISVISDRWMHAESRLTLSFQNLIPPEKFPAHTPLLDLQPLPVQALKIPEYVDLFQQWEQFNRIQTQTFNALFQTDESVFVGAPTGSGKTVCAEFAILRHWSRDEPGKIVYLAPFQELVDTRQKAWQARLSSLRGGRQVVQLTGDMTADLKLLTKADLILATPAQWDMMSRQWQRRKSVQNVTLLIADDLHMLGASSIYEIVMSRSQAIKNQLENNLRTVGISVSLSNARDVGEWIGASKQNVFNFSPNVRPIPLNLHLQSFTIPHFPSLMLAMVKPTYQAILQYAANEPAMVFVPDRKQTRATAQNLLAACAAGNDDSLFLHADLEQLEPILAKVKERTLAQSLSHGIAYFHEALDPSDKRIAETLFAQGAAQVLLVSRDCCWEIQSTAHLVVIMGTQFFQGRDHRYIDYPISDLLQMFGKAGRPMVDKESRGLLMTPDVKRNYYRKFLGEALPIESQLQSDLSDALLTEISTKTIESTQDALDWTTYTFFYRRLLANPTYYELKTATHDGLSNFLSDQVETTLQDLANANLIEIDEDDDSVTPLQSALIAAYYSISYITMQTLMLSLKRNTKLKGILEIVTAATEFEDIPIRRHETHVLERIYDRVPAKLSEANFESPHFKAFVLLQAHFSRMQLPVDLAKDQELVLRKVLNLLSACVDVLSSEGHLNASISVMELSQMVVQAMWDRDSPMKQLPHFDDSTIDACSKAGISDVHEFQDAMDPEDPNYGSLIKAMGLSNRQLADVARFVNEKYPSVELDFELEDADEVVAEAPTFLNVTLRYEAEEDEEPDFEVQAPYFPAVKLQQWWIVLGDNQTKNLLAVRRVPAAKEIKVRLEFELPEPGTRSVTVYLINDSYFGLDQAPTLDVVAAERMDESAEE